MVALIIDRKYTIPHYDVADYVAILEPSLASFHHLVVSPTLISQSVSSPTLATMDSLRGVTLVTSDGTTVLADNILNDKNIILFYFSAHWCPPCRQFTPLLKDFYGDVKSSGVEVVFVSSDRSAADMLSYMRESHGDWPALQHNSRKANELKHKFNISGIPALVVVRRDGTLVTKDGRSYVTSKGPAAAVREWSKAAPFQGKGNVLGCAQPDAPALPPAGNDTANEEKAAATAKVDTDKPTTNVQVRLADGSRLVVRLNHGHSVGDLRRYIRRARPQYDGVSFLLLTTFPSQELADDSQTLAAAGLLGAAVMQRIK